MYKSKFAAASALSSCTILGLYGYQQNEMLGTKPIISTTFILEHTQENQFSNFIV